MTDAWRYAVWPDPRSRSSDTKSRTNIKNPTKKILDIVVYFKNWRSFASSHCKWRRRQTSKKCNFRNFRSPVTLTSTLDRVIRHTVMHQSSTSIYKPNFTEIGKTFCGMDGWMYGRTDERTDAPTDGHFRPPLMLIGRLGEVDLKIKHKIIQTENSTRVNKTATVLQWCCTNNIQTSNFHIVDKYSILWIIVYAVSVASSYDASMDAWNIQVLNCAVWRDCVVHLICAAANDRYWSMQAAITNKPVKHENGHRLVCSIKEHPLLLLHPFNHLFCRTSWVGRHQKGKPFWILLEQEMMEVSVASAGPHTNHLHLAPDR